MNIKVRKRTGNIDIQKELRKTEKHPLFNVTLVSDETINMSGRSSIRKNRFERKAYALKRPVLKTLFFIGMMCFIGGCLSITIAFFKTPVNADNSICNSDKCEARLKNIKGCEKKYTDKKDIVLCATQKVVRTRKNEMTVNDFRTTREEIENLYNMMYVKNDIKTKLYEFVMKGEGSFQEKAFCDSYYKTKTGLVRHKPKDCTRWSIGFGTISYQGEKITYEEAIKRKQEDLNHRLSLIKSDCLTDNQKIAVVDFMYQHGQNASGIVKKANNCQVKEIYGTISWWRDNYKKKKQSGMVKREQMRLNIFYK